MFYIYIIVEKLEGMESISFTFFKNVEMKKVIQK